MWYFVRRTVAGMRLSTCWSMWGREMASSSRATCLTRWKDFFKDKKFLFDFGLWISKYVSSNLSKTIKIEMRNYFLARLRWMERTSIHFSLSSKSHCQHPRMTLRAWWQGQWKSCPWKNVTNSQFFSAPTSWSGNQWGGQTSRGTLRSSWLGGTAPPSSATPATSSPRTLRQTSRTAFKVRHRMDNGGKVGKNDVEIWNAEAEKSIDVTTPAALLQFIQIVPNKLLHSTLDSYCFSF